LVFLELQHMNLRPWVLAAQLRKHGAGQNDAAHLGEQNDQDVLGRLRHACGATQQPCATHPQRDYSTQQLTHPAVYKALRL
jgi:hypothetical protein